MKFRIPVALLTGAGALAFVTAHAQTAANSPAAAGAELQEVTVTGSRVITNGADSPTALTVVSTQQLMDLAPTTIADALNALPVFAGSKTQDSRQTTGTGPYGGGNASANELNLHNAGLTSTLILWDGQRLAPTLINGVNDVDMIPQLLVQRVDIVTGGSSAVYGSDAIAGVVNYVTDAKFNGVKVEAQGGVSTYGDDQGFKAGIAGGMSLFGGPGHIEASVERYTNAGILALTDRPNLASLGAPGAGTPANPYVLTNGLRTNTASAGSLITNGPLKGYTFNTPGVATPFVHGIATGTASTEIGGDGYFTNQTLVAPESMDQYFGRFDYDFSNVLHGHLDAMYTDKTDFQDDGGTSITNDTLTTTNPFLSSALQAQLSAGGLKTFTFSKYYSPDELPETQNYGEQQYFQLSPGLDGKLGKYSWAVNFNYARSVLYNTQKNDINRQNLSAALNSSINPANGQIVCAVTLTNPTADPGCVPYNPFGPGAANGAANSYILGNPWYTAAYHFYDANAQISGDVFNTWAGPVTAALSVEWRKENFEAATNAPPTLLQNCTGLPYNCTAASAIWASAIAPSTPASESVTEGALELNVPLLKDVPLAKKVNLNLAGREVAYSTVGHYTPWKVGPEWQITDDFRLRGTYSRDITAPTLYELNYPTAVSFGNQTDYLNDPNGTVQYNTYSITQGNPNGLKAEIGETRTAGFVWQPSGTRLTITSDYFHIRINNWIILTQASSQADQQACYVSGGNSPYCALIIRPNYTTTSPTNLVSAFYQEWINIASVETYGDDTELDYATTMAGGHPVDLRLIATWQPHIFYVQPANDKLDGGNTASGPTPQTAAPALSATGVLTIGVTDRFEVQLNERWFGPMRLSDNETCVYGGCLYAPNNHVASIGYTGVNLSYTLGEKKNLQVYLNIRNLFNTPPNPAPLAGGTGPGPGFATNEDVIGRYFVAGVRAQL